MSVIVATTVVVKAEETAKFEVVTQQIYAAFKKFCTNVTSQENVDKAKDYTNKGLELTEKSFIQYPMYIPAAFFFGRASMAAKIIDVENLSKELSKALKRTKSRNMWIGGGLSLGHLYYNRNEKPVTVNSVENKQEKVLPTEKNEPAA